MTVLADHRVTNEGRYPIKVWLAGRGWVTLDPGTSVVGGVGKIVHGDRSANYSVKPETGVRR